MPVLHFNEAEDLPREEVGNKAYGLIQATNAGFNVPHGIVITASECKYYFSLSGDSRPQYLMMVTDTVLEKLAYLEKRMGRRCTVSVRSGAAVSMPGAMDSILNVLLGTDHYPLKDYIQDYGEAVAINCMTRLISQYAKTVDKMPNAPSPGSTMHELKEAALGYRALKIKKFPASARVQLSECIRAVWHSWYNPEAVEYRKAKGIPDDLFTAVTIQAMVLGNEGSTGVVFSRNPKTGAPGLWGEFKDNAQGEDIVAGGEGKKQGVHTIDKYPTLYHTPLETMVNKIEKTLAKDMVEVEWTRDGKELWLLQWRVGKRESAAAFKIAHDHVVEGLISQDEALTRFNGQDWVNVNQPQVDPFFDIAPDYYGEPASSGVGVGMAHMTSEDACEYHANGHKVVLVREMTEVSDLQGMRISEAIVTEKGGLTCHAAVLARDFNIPCVVGVGEIDIPTGVQVTVCGTTGRIWVGVDVTLTEGKPSHEALTMARMKLKRHADLLKVGTDISRWPKMTGIGLYIEAADLATLTQDEAVGRFKKIFNDTAGGEIIDLRGPEEFSMEEDSEVNAMFGVSDWQDVDIVSAFIEAASDLEDAPTVIAPKEYESTLEEYGVTVLRQNQSLFEILDGTGPVCIGEKLIKELGGHERAVKLAELCKAAGRKITQVPVSMTLDYAMHQG